MRVLLASEYFYPATKGGTEMYVYQLAKELIENGHECAVLSLSSIETNSEYEGIKIFYAPFIDDLAQELENPSNFNHIKNCVNSYQPDIFHLHTLTPSLGINHLVKLGVSGVKTVFTTHITSFSCLRGDLMLYGKEVCDGLLDRGRCMDCFLQYRGYENSTYRAVLTELSNYSIAKVISPSLNIYDNKLVAIEKFKNIVNHVVVVSNWQEEVLSINEFDKNKVSVCRQAVNNKDILPVKEFSENKKLKVGFVGRIVKIKGLHFLLDVFKSINSSNAELYIAGIKSADEVEYYNEMKKLANSLSVIWNEDLDSSNVLQFLDGIDVLVVPSLWLETGPYVIFEALARKVPVLTFNKGGAMELIDNNVNGWLVNTTADMKNKLMDLISNKDQVIDASRNIAQVRNTSNLFDEMLAVYKKVI